MSRARGGWRAVLGMNARNDHIDRVNDWASVSLVNDKVATKLLLAASGLPVPPTVAVIENRRDLASLTADRLPDAWALKPNHGRGGSGILLAGSREGADWRGLSGRRLTMRDVVDHTRLVLQGEYSPAGRPGDSALVEPLLRTSEELARVAGAGMPDVRVICRDGTPIAAMLRLPTVASGGRANLHQGGIGAAVDLDSGRVSAARWRGRPCVAHPDTGQALVGLRVPAWREVLETAAACADATGLRYLGADIVFDRTHGHLVLEVNARPGLEIQNVQGRGLAPDLVGHRSPLAVPGQRTVEPSAVLVRATPC
jgi:alpha-L-glutamate ligase-like protein